jgi:hypothetical protein
MPGCIRFRSTGFSGSKTVREKIYFYISKHLGDFSITWEKHRWVGKKTLVPPRSLGSPREGGVGEMNQ